MVSKSPVSARALRVFSLALIVSLAFAGLAAGSASALSLETKANKFPIPFSASGGATSLSWSNGSAFTCGGNTSSSSGEWTSGTSGQTKIKLQECKGAFNVSCTTPGQPAGTIQTNMLAMKPVYLDAAHTQYGILFTVSPATFTGRLAEYECAGIPHVWTGGVIGRISSPALNTYSTKHTLNFETIANGVQRYQQVEGAGTLYRLEEGGSTVGLTSTLSMYYPGGEARFVP
jgi:hypothetical protein